MIISFLKKILFYVWQLPQHLLALLILGIIKVLKCKVDTSKSTEFTKVYIVKNGLIGISLGQYIIISSYSSKDTLAHEYGHSIQSLYFGPLYLIVIGIPSLVMNILSNVFYFYGYKKFAENYYKRWPESWADKLGKLDRH